MNEKFQAVYVADRVLGEGAFGKVYGVHNQRAENFALKVLKSKASPNLHREAVLLLRVSHPHLPALHEYLPQVQGIRGVTERGPGLLLEYIEGQSLEAWQATEHPSFEEFQNYFLQALRALAYLHDRGILHGDIKPSNFIISKRHTLKLLDFGLAGMSGEAAGEVKGSLDYLAPEALAGQRLASSDLFSLAAVFYRMLSGKAPYDLGLDLAHRFQTPPAALASEKSGGPPDYFNAVLLRMLHADPAARLSSAWAVLKTLQPHLSKTQLKEGRAAFSSELPWVGRPLLREAMAAFLHAWEAGSPRSVAFVLSGASGSGCSRALAELEWMAKFREVEVSRMAPQFWLQAGSSRPTDDEKCLWIFSDLHQLSDRDLEHFFSNLNDRLVQARHVGLVLEFNADLATPSLLAAIEALAADLKTDWKLTPFSPEETQAYLRERFVLASIDSQVLAALQHLSAGLPAWLQLICDRLEKSTGIPASLRELSLAEMQELRMPAERNQQFETRYRRLSVAEQELLGVMALVGRPGTANFFAGIFEPGEARCEECLRQLESGAWVARVAVGWELFPPALRGVLRTLLPAEKRARLAQRAFQTLRQESPQDFPLLSTLAQEAGLMSEYRAFGQRAAEQMAHTGRVGEAIHLYQEMLRHFPGREEQKIFYAHLASLYGRLARFDEALEAYDNWYRYADDDGRGLKDLKYRYLTGLVYFNRGDRKQAREKLQKALLQGDAALPEHRPLHQKILAVLGKIFEQEQKWEKARECYDRGLALSVEDAPEKAELLRQLGSLALAQGEAVEGERVLRESLRMSRALGYEDGMANAAYVLAGFKQSRQDYEAALRFYHQALEIAERRRDALKMGRIRSNMASALIEIADYARALEHSEKAESLLQQLGNADDRWLARFQQTTLATYLGRFAAAFDEALQSQSQASSRRDLAPHLWQLQGEAFRLQRDFKGALQSYRKASQGFSQAGRELEAEECKMREALTECLAGDLEAARVRLGELEADAPPLTKTFKALFFLSAEAPLEAVQEGSNALLKSAQQETVLLMLRALAECRSRMQDANGAEFFRQKAHEWLSGLYRALPEEMRLGFENREDFQKLAEQQLKRPMDPGISRERFLTYARIHQRLNAEPDMHAIVEQVMDAAMALAGAERGFLLVSDAGSQAQVIPGFRVETARNMKKENLGQGEFKISLSVVEEALRRRVPILTDDARADPKFRQAESVHLYQLKSILVLPLVSEQGCLGALYLDHRFEIGAFNDESLLFLKVFADQAVTAIEKARTLTELARAKRSLEKRVVQQAQQIEQMEFELKEARKELKYGYEEIIGQSPKMIKVLQLLDRVTDTRIPIWVHGESGTGKELIARALHYNSDRKAKPFIAENCSAIPENLLESVLFGHVRGAFTHAEKDRMGLFEAANGGTIFLDEIGDMPLPMQAKLLRVLQEGEVRRVGSHQAIKVDVRVVSATNKNLPALVKTGEFREDLYFRLNGLKIDLPPLRERKEDIPLLMQHFLEQVAEESGIEACAISREAITLLANYDWPGNIRELQNAARNALIFAEGRTITPEMLGFKPELFHPPSSREAGLRRAQPSAQRSSNPEREAILDALVRANYHKGEAAQELKVTARHLYNLLEKFELPKNKWALKKLVEEERGFNEI